MIDHRRKLILVHIARTGGTSIESAVIGSDWWGVDSASKHLSASQARQLYGDEIWSSYTTFAVVRNPWDRLVSMWRTGWWHESSGLSRNCRFSEFVRKLKPHPHEKYNSLFYHEIIDEPVDYELRFEHLGRDLNQMLNAISCEALSLPHCERRDRPHYREMFDEELANFVGLTYGTDIRNYGYSFS